MKRTIMILAVAMMAASIFFAGCSADKPGRYDDFAQCLTDNGVVMHGTEWCKFCQKQKEMFGNSFKLIDYVDCDKNQAVCVAAGVQSYPTWKIDGEFYPGVQQFTTLKRLTGCEIEPNAALSGNETAGAEDEGNAAGGACDLNEEGVCTFPG